MTIYNRGEVGEGAHRCPSSCHHSYQGNHVQKEPVDEHVGKQLDDEEEENAEEEGEEKEEDAEEEEEEEEAATVEGC